MSGVTLLASGSAILSGLAFSSGRPVKTIACSLALAAVLPASALGQVLTFSARSDLVVFSATATDHRGHPITDLRRDEFRVYEDGRLQPIAHFHEGRGLPARILLLVDASGSMNDEWKVASARRAGGDWKSSGRRRKNSSSCPAISSK